MKILRITPMAKPRMTQRDKWNPRPIVQRYWDYKLKLQLLASTHNLELSDELSCTFVIQIPKSWSEKKKREHFMKAHKVRPDLDNLVKALQDCLLREDSHVWRYKDVKKVWGYEGQIEFF